MRLESIEDFVALFDRQRASAGKRGGDPYDLARDAKLEVGICLLNHPSAPVVDGVFSTLVRIGYSTHALGLRGEMETNSFYPYELLRTRKSTNWKAIAELLSTLDASMRSRFAPGPKPLWFLVRSESEVVEIIELFDGVAKQGRGRPPRSRELLYDKPDIDVDWLQRRLSLSAKTNRHRQEDVRLRYLAYHIRGLVLSAYVDRLPTFSESVSKKSGNGKITYLDTEKLYCALPESPKAEIKNFHECLALVGKSVPEIVDDLIEGLSPFSARAIAAELSANAQTMPQDIMGKASIEELTAACEKSMKKRRGRADSATQQECVRKIRELWRSIAGPRGNCITYAGSNPSGDCYDLIQGLNQQLRVNGFLPIEPLTEAE